MQSGEQGAVRRNIGLVLAAMIMVSVVAAAAVIRSQHQHDIATFAEANCLQIEALKTEFREQALESYRNLERDARLLGIPLTRELREAAIASRDRRLERFAAREC